MDDLDQALTRMRATALARLARQRGLTTSPVWLAFALHQRSLGAALTLLTNLRRSSPPRRFQMMVSCFWFSKKKALARVLTRARQTAS